MRENISSLLYCSDHILGILSLTAISRCRWPCAAATRNGSCSAIIGRYITARLLTKDVGSGVGVEKIRKPVTTNMIVTVNQQRGVENILGLRPFLDMQSETLGNITDVKAVTRFAREVFSDPPRYFVRTKHT